MCRFSIFPVGRGTKINPRFGGNTVYRFFDEHLLYEIGCFQWLGNHAGVENWGTL